MTDVLREDNRKVYVHLQRRMIDGDLAEDSVWASDKLYRLGGAWTPDRLRMHAAILEEFKARWARLPRDGHAVLFTAGPPGSGKGTALNLLRTRQGDMSELGQALADAHGVNVADYVVLDTDELKEAIVRHGGAPDLPADARHLPGGRQLAPAEVAGLIHRESAFLRDTFEDWARRHGYNLLYDGAMMNGAMTRTLLTDLAREGYGSRVVLSVEVPLQTSLEQNAIRWELGREAFEAGRDPYGGRMVPETLIHQFYENSGTDYSISRVNARAAHDQGLVTSLIELDRGHWTTAQPTHSPATLRMAYREASMRLRTHT